MMEEDVGSFIIIITIVISGNICTMLTIHYNRAILMYKLVFPVTRGGGPCLTCCLSRGNFLKKIARVMFAKLK